MMDSVEGEATSEDVLQSFKLFQAAAFDLIQDDPHEWSDRPCTTCRAVSTMIQRPFGCVLFTKQKLKTG